MLATKQKSRKMGSAKKKGLVTYRGVRLQAIFGRSKFTEAELREAIESALKKHATTIAGRSVR